MNSLPDQDKTLCVKAYEVCYFALLREERGVAEETIQSRAETPRALFEELAARYAFSLGVRQLQVAVNDRFSDWEMPLADGDRVVFLPPVTGG